MGGRLKHAYMPESAKHPVILPHDSKVSQMIVQEMHNDVHLGTEWVLSRLRRKYWITKARKLIKSVKNKCVTCKKLYAAPMSQKMADLPVERCVPGKPPFTFVGVDLCGPFYVKRGRATAKSYACVYTCFTTRAIHLEKLDSLETDSFINGFLRFAARRGYPTKVWSDNGTNLVGARQELRSCLRQLDRDKVIRCARRNEVEWIFNPPHASHQGGVWERMIRTLRKILVALLNASPVTMTDEVLQTILCDIESIVNSRPITKCSDDVDDATPLTPNHMLILQSNLPLPWGNFVLSDIYRRRWKHVQHVSTQFWRRWLREYLPQLQLRSKWLKIERNLKVGDLVLVCDHMTPRGEWPMELITETTVGRDGLIRSARVRMNSGILVRPITKLVLLEGDD